MARRTELVKFALIIDINKKILYYLSYLQDKDDKLIQGRSQYEANRSVKFYQMLSIFFFIRHFTALECQWTQKNRPCIQKYITILKAKVSEISDQWASLFYWFILVFLVFHMVLQRIHQNIKGLKIIKISKGFRFFSECRTTLIFTILGPNDHHPRLTVTVFQNKRLHTKFRLKLFYERLLKGPQHAGYRIAFPRVWISSWTFLRPSCDRREKLLAINTERNLVLRMAK